MPDVKYKCYLVGTFLVAACFMNKIDLRIYNGYIVRVFQLNRQIKRGMLLSSNNGCPLFRIVNKKEAIK